MVQAAQPFSTGTSFVIRELTGEKRTITLKGRGLPRRPFTLSGSMRTDLTWYAGSPEGTLQVMGATLDDTMIGGKWSDRFISLEISEEVRVALEREQTRELFNLENGGGIAGQPLRFKQDIADAAAPITITADGESPIIPLDVADIVDTIDSMRRQGQIMEVSWGRQLRRGIMKRFVQKWHTLHDVEWEMSFQWMSQDEAFLDSIAVEAGNKFDLDASIDAANDSLAIVTAEPFTAPSTGTLSLVERARASSIVTGVDRFGQTINTGFKSLAETITEVQTAIFDLEDVAIQTSRNVVGFINSAKRVAGAWDFLKRRADDMALLLENVEDAIALNEVADVGDRLTSRKKTRDRRQGARRIVNDSARQQDAVLKQINPELLRSFTARADQDLRDIATLHYGTPDAWQALLQYNNLSSSKLEAGQLVFVPRNPPKVEC